MWAEMGRTEGVRCNDPHKGERHNTLQLLWLICILFFFLLFHLWDEHEGLEIKGWGKFGPLIVFVISSYFRLPFRCSWSTNAFQPIFLGQKTRYWFFFLFLVVEVVKFFSHSCLYDFICRYFSGNACWETQSTEAHPVLAYEHLNLSGMSVIPTWYQSSF